MLNLLLNLVVNDDKHYHFLQEIYSFASFNGHTFMFTILQPLLET